MEDVVDHIRAWHLIVQKRMLPGGTFVQSDPQGKEIRTTIKLFLGESELIWRDVERGSDHVAGKGDGFAIAIKGNSGVNEHIIRVGPLNDIHRLNIAVDVTILGQDI